MSSSASSVNLSGGVSFDGRSQGKGGADSAQSKPEGNGIIPVNNGNNWSWQTFPKTGVNTAAAGVSSDSGSDSSTTRSGISEGTLIITDGAAQQQASGQTAQEAAEGIERQVRTGDDAGGLAKTWDGQQLLQEQAANAQIAAAFGQQASQAVEKVISSQRFALQEKAKEAQTMEEYAQIAQDLKDLELQERALNILVGALAGVPGSAVTKETLAYAAQEMRDFMIEDSAKFAGVVGVSNHGEKDGQAHADLSNLSGPSEGSNGDGQKIGGTRVDLDRLCGVDNRRCITNNDGSLKKDALGRVQFDEKAAGMTLATFLKNTEEGRKMSGLTGGIQGAGGELIGKPYASGSLQDKVIELFAGPHDYIGGWLTGLYDEQGNIKRDMSSTERAIYDNVITVGAIPVAAPFAAAQGISPEVWNALSVLLKAVK